MLLTGTFVRSLDEKQRIALPKPIRDALGHPLEAVLYLAPGTDGSLTLYTETSFSHFAAQLAADSPNALEVRAFSRLFYAQAQRIDIDRQGRIRIPSELAQLASLGKEIVLLGVRDHLELWNRTRWESYLAQQQAHYDEIAERAFSRRVAIGPPNVTQPHGTAPAVSPYLPAAAEDHRSDEAPIVSEEGKPSRPR